VGLRKGSNLFGLRREKTFLARGGGVRLAEGDLSGGGVKGYVAKEKACLENGKTHCVGGGGGGTKRLKYLNDLRGNLGGKHL